MTMKKEIPPVQVAGGKVHPTCPIADGHDHGLTNLLEDNLPLTGLAFRHQQ
jgi:hypothetical protein